MRVMCFSQHTRVYRNFRVHHSVISVNTDCVYVSFEINVFVYNLV